MLELEIKEGECVNEREAFADNEYAYILNGKSKMIFTRLELKRYIQQKKLDTRNFEESVFRFGGRS